MKDTQNTKSGYSSADVRREDILDHFTMESPLPGKLVEKLAVKHGVGFDRIKKDIIDLIEFGCLKRASFRTYKKCAPYEKPTPEKDEANYRERECIVTGCDVIFRSEHNGHRMCAKHRKGSTNDYGLAIYTSDSAIYI